MRRFHVLAIAVMLGFCSSANAGLGPTKGSQLVTVLTSGGCPIPFNGSSPITFSQMVTADGALIPFTTPPKRIFGITDVTITGAGEPAGDAILLTVSVGSASGGSTIAGEYATVAGNTSFAATFTFPAGVAVRSGSVACAVPLNYTHPGSVTASATAHGFFAPDK